MSLIGMPSGSKDPLGTIFGVINTVTSIVDKIDRDSAPAPAPKVEIINPSPAPAVARNEQPPININLTINVYKGDSDKPLLEKTDNGISLNLK